MSIADKAEPLTPIVRFKRRRRAVTVFVLLLSFVVVSLSATVLLVNDGRNLKRLVDKFGIELPISWTSAEAARPPERFRRSSRLVGSPRRLLVPEATFASPLSRVATASAHERCRNLAIPGAPPPAFRAAGGEWECVVSQDLGTGPEPSVLFIQARGESADTFRTFRAKLSYLDPEQDTQLTQAVMQSVKRFGVTLPEEGRRYLENKIVARSGFTSMLEPYRITFERERDDERRFNLLIVNNASASSCGSHEPHASGAPLRASTARIHLGCVSLPPIAFRS